MSICETLPLLVHKKSELKRVSPLGKPLDYEDDTDNGVDHLEGARGFMQEIEDHVREKARSLAAARKKKGLPEYLVKPRRQEKAASCKFIDPAATESVAHLFQCSQPGTRLKELPSSQDQRLRRL